MRGKRSAAGPEEKAGAKRKEKEQRVLELATDVMVLLTAVACVLLLTGLVQHGLLLDAAFLFGILLHCGLAFSLFLREKRGLAAVSAGAALALVFCLLFAVF